MLSPQDRTVLINALSDIPQFSTADGRQSFIRGEFRDYPFSTDIDKTLRSVNWDRPPYEVASRFIDLLDGHEVAPAVPALAVIAQAIESIAGAANREKILALRRRMRWLVDLTPALVDVWRDLRSPVELVQERIIGENTLKHLFHLRHALTAADAVVRIDRGLLRGTGFLVAPNLLMTNNHVISTPQDAAASRACFFDELNDGEAPRPKVFIPLIAADFHTDKDLDFSLVRLASPAPSKHTLPLRAVVMQQNQRVSIIQHPDGDPKQISMQNNMVAAADERLVQYYTSTRPGSSGSPVFDDDFTVVAIHHGSTADKSWDTAAYPRITDPAQLADIHHRNQGTSLIAIQKHLEQSAPELLRELSFR